MNLSGIAVRAAKQTELFMRRNAPTILTTTGVAGFIGTVALTIRATNRAIDVLPEISRDIRVVKDKEIDANYTAQNKAGELTGTYFNSAVKLGEIYGPVLLLGSASIFCVISAHGMMLKRQASLVAAYSALDASFRAYRKRVAEKIGETEELELYRRPKMRALDGDDEAGEGDACQIDFDDILPSPYARFFDETSRNWTKTPEYNLMFLRAQQDWANDRLTAYGFLFLNEVYEALGFDRSQAGQIVGWKKNGNGDGFVDFGLYQIGDECNRAFVNGIEHTVLLDFNVDGIIKI
jgi:Family of unknown function (DUF6353)